MTQDELINRMKATEDALRDAMALMSRGFEVMERMERQVQGQFMDVAQLRQRVKKLEGGDS